MTEQRPLVPVSWGEVVDRKTILEIKVERLRSPASVKNVSRELEALRATLDAITPTPEVLGRLEAALREVNRKLWDIEDAIRRKEADNSFDTEFIELARSVYRMNDERYRLKREISVLLRSDLLDEKQYTPY
jgi:hypothetical protein